MAADTTSTAHQAQLAAYRRLTRAERVAIAIKMSDDARAIARAGIATRHPDYRPQQIALAAARLILGDELFRCAFRGAPALPL